MFWLKKFLAELKIYKLLHRNYEKLNETNEGFVPFSKSEYEHPNYKGKTITEVAGDANLARIIIEEWLKEGIVEERPPIFKPRSNLFRLTPLGFSPMKHPLIRRFSQFFSFLKPIIRIIEKLL